jgi:hypothetical protein
MAAPTLNDYEYQYKDAGVGVLLNGTTALPFWDVNTVAGLADFPELAYDVLDLDGQHGGFVTGNYFKHRMLIPEGILFSLPVDVETNNELLKATIVPDGIDYPFYWKHPNKTQRYFMAKPVNYGPTLILVLYLGLQPSTTPSLMLAMLPLASSLVLLLHLLRQQILPSRTLPRHSHSALAAQSFLATSSRSTSRS